MSRRSSIRSGTNILTRGPAQLADDASREEIDAGISINSDGVVHPCCYVVSPAHAIGRSSDAVDALRNGKVLRSGRRFYQRLAAGENSVASHEPCLSCSVVTSTAGHVTTQTNFRQLYEYVLRGVPMRW